MPYMPAGMPLPDVEDREAAEFWSAARRHELVVQRCSDCGAFRHTPMPICHVCRSWRYEWKPVSGQGTVFTYTIAWNPVHPALRSGRCPYSVVVVELPDAGNVRMVGNAVDCSEDEIYVGMPVEIAWDDVNEDVTLPQWRPVRQPAP